MRDNRQHLADMATGGESTHQREGGRGSGRAVAFGAAGQSAQISLICVTQMNNIQTQQPGTIQREPLSECREVRWSCRRPCLGYMSSVGDTTATQENAVHRFIPVSGRPASLHTMARRAALPMSRAVCPVTLCILWCYSSCCLYSLKSSSPCLNRADASFPLVLTHVCGLFLVKLFQHRVPKIHIKKIKILIGKAVILNKKVSP